jgi:hypothetical protein
MEKELNGVITTLVNRQFVRESRSCLGEFSLSETISLFPGAPLHVVTSFKMIPPKPSKGWRSV